MTKTIPPEENASKKKIQALFELKNHSGGAVTIAPCKRMEDSSLR
jgi:hypothetical protein